MIKIRIYILFAIFILLGNSTKAQFNIGISVSPLFIKGDYRENIGTDAYPNMIKKEIDHIFYNEQLNFGYDFPLLKFRENKFALGTSFKIALGYFMADQLFENQFSLDLPQYITFRYGRRSNSLNEMAWGTGIGLGYHFRLAPLPVAIPGAFIDYTFYRNFYLNISIDLIPSEYYSNFSSEGLVHTFNTRQLSFMLGYSL